ncbi:hypothetical protein JCM8547_007725 [Rhodosporidiobolus lusitaniae]
MSRPSLVIVAPATVADLPRLAQIQRDAFAPSSITRFIFANVSAEDHAAQATARLAKALQHPYKAVMKAILNTSGEVAAMGFWELPKPEGYVEEKQEERRFPPGTNVELAKELFGQLDFGIKERQLHLSILVVDPKYQKTGAGSTMLRWGCKLADEEKVPMYLEATDVGVPLYKRYGFVPFRPPVVVKAGVNDEIVLFPMMRPALSLSPLSRTDLPHLPQIYRLAFAPTLINQYCFPGVTPEAYQNWITSRMEAVLEAMEKGGGEREAVVARQGEKIVGYAMWSYEKGKTEGEQEKTERTFPAGADLARSRGFMGKFDAFRETIKEEHYSLDNLVILPEAQGTGIGKALCQVLLDKAREKELPAYLESTELGRIFYAKLGFTEFAAPLRPDDQLDVDMLWPMVYRQSVD